MAFGLLPYQEILLISIGISILLTLISKFLANQDALKKARKDTDFYKEKMRKAQKSGDLKKANEYASEMMKVSSRQFKYSMRPMIFSLLIFFVIAGWMNTSFGGVTLDFAANPNATFNYAGSAHKVLFEPGNGSMRAGVDFNDDGWFSQEEIFEQNQVFGYQNVYWRATPAMEGFLLFTSPKENAVHFEMLVVKSPFMLPLLGEYLPWIYWYIIIVLVFSTIFRKLLDVV